MEFTTPVGRLVQGSVFEGQTHDQQGKPYIIKTGPNAGQPTTKFFFAVAFPKKLANGADNLVFLNWYRQVIDTARAGYPQFFNGAIDPFTGKPGCTHPRMTYKIMDGDGVDANGKSNNQKEGFAGHYVVKFNSQYAPRVFENGKFSPEQQIQDKSRVKTGYYVAVMGTCEANIGSDVPGVFMNGNMVCLVAAGPEIVGGPDASAAFGTIDMSTLPPGVTPGATPANIAPNIPTPGAAVVPAQSYAPAAVATAVPAMAYAPAVAPQAPVAAQPNQGFVANAGAPSVPVAPPPAPVAPVPPAGPQLTALGIQQGGTYENFRSSGWTDEQMRSAGFLV